MRPGARNRKARDLRDKAHVSLIPALGLRTPHEPFPAAKHTLAICPAMAESAIIEHPRRAQADELYGEQVCRQMKVLAWEY
jgi:hypothetical protein